MLNGGSSDPPDHCYWAGTDFLEALAMEGIEFTADQQKEVNRLATLCRTEGEDGWQDDWQDDWEDDDYREEE